jgi:GntR family transcriptional regulator
VEAVCADTGLARLLDLPLGAPVLYVTRLLRQRDDRLLVLFRSHFRADRYYYTVENAGARRRAAKVAR